MKKDVYLTVPNILTAIRLGIAVYIFYTVFVWKEDDLKLWQLTIAVVATIAFATDFLDGLIAKTWESQRSRIGATWDPIADKMAVIAFVAYVYAAGVFDPYIEICLLFVGLIVLREISISLLRWYVGHDRIPVVEGGRIKTAVQMAALLLFGFLPILPAWGIYVAVAVLGYATYLTVKSGWGYFRPFVLDT